MKKQLLTLGLVIVSLSFIAQDLSNGLLLHYDFNGNANDISGNGMHATVSGATLTTDKDGNISSAYSLDGVDDYIELPNDASLKPQFPLTISCSVRFDDLSVVENRNGALNTDYTPGLLTGVTLGVSNGVLSLSYGDGGLSRAVNRVSARGSTMIQQGTWYHVVGIIHAESDMDIYLDCEQESITYDGTGDAIVYSNSPGRLGEFASDISGVPNDYFFQGALDNIRYWDRALTQQEVDLLCQTTVEVKENVEENLVSSIYPNPSSGNFSITFSDSQVKSIQLVDVTGKLIETWSEFNQNELNVTNLEKGMYLLKVSNGIFQATQRIVVSE